MLPVKIKGKIAQALLSRGLDRDHSESLGSRERFLCSYAFGYIDTDNGYEDSDYRGYGQVLDRFCHAYAEIQAGIIGQYNTAGRPDDEAGCQYEEKAGDGASVSNPFQIHIHDLAHIHTEGCGHVPPDALIKINHDQLEVSRGYGFMIVLPEIGYPVDCRYDHQHGGQNIGYECDLPGIQGFTQRLFGLLHGVVQAQTPEEEIKAHRSGDEPQSKVGISQETRDCKHEQGQSRRNKYGMTYLGIGENLLEKVVGALQVGALFDQHPAHAVDLDTGLD